MTIHAKIRKARTLDDWREVHREAIARLTALLEWFNDDETMARCSSDYSEWEAIECMAHEIVAMRTLALAFNAPEKR